MYNILVTGGNGQLGSEIRGLIESYPQYHFFFTDVATLDICNKETIALFIKENKITVIINCAAYTAVDKAESDSKLADTINHLAVKHLAELAKIYNCKFIHISTDYVFDGNNYKPYNETDEPNPQSVYGSTKLAGELALQKINPENTIIIRTSWVYSSYGNNFVKTMLKLGKERDFLNVIHDQIGTPTYAADLAKVILEILPNIKNKEVELFHFTNEGVCSWFDFAKAIFESANVNCNVIPISTAQYHSIATRPAYSIMDKTKIKETFNVIIPYWRDSLSVAISLIEE